GGVRMGQGGGGGGGGGGGSELEGTRALPSGRVTFLFTDIEGSPRLWEQYPEARRLGLARHDGLLRIAIESHGGCVFKTVGDQFCAAFATVPEAILAALAGQQALRECAVGSEEGGVPTPDEPPPPPASVSFGAFPSGAAPPPDSAARTPHSIRVRMAVHAGAVEQRDGDYFGPPLNRVARLLDAGHGGQILLTEAAADLARDALPAGVTLRDL